jgi:hypothetical protein
MRRRLDDPDAPTTPPVHDIADVVASVVVRFICPEFAALIFWLMAMVPDPALMLIDRAIAPASVVRDGFPHRDVSGGRNVDDGVSRRDSRRVSENERVRLAYPDVAGRCAASSVPTSVETFAPVAPIARSPRA